MGSYVKRVSERLSRLSDEEVRRLFLRVAGENSMLDSIIDSLSIGLIIVDRQWKILQCNKAAKRYLLAGSYDEALCEKESVWDSLSETEIADFLKDAAEKDKSNVSEDFTTACSDGSVRFLNVSVTSFVHQTEISGNIIKIEDVTQKKNQDVLLHRMENMAGLTNLAAGMAHEIKNPLGAISIHIQLIQRALKKARDENKDLPDKKFLEDHLDVVNQEIDGLNHLVMDFLFAVRPVNANLTLSSPDKIIQNIVDFFTPEFNRYHVQVECDLHGDEKRILIDEKLFREVLVNIAQNAFSAIKSRYEICSKENVSEDSFMPGKIYLSSKISEDKFYVKIGDNGSGMDEETLNRIFEPYFTTKANGTGLGMTMAYKIIKEFSGDIQVKSKKGEGSEFTIVLPVPQTDKKLIE
ncbi:MAG: PAS domain S-box protein [Treponema sp.]|nr:PAS domain S-box protein [Treponema sp.]